jgi:DNA-binding response OmpR family regulator
MGNTVAKRVLIADDDETNRDLITRSLDKDDIETYEAVDGREALAKAREIMPDLIILDIMMPVKSGYEVCEQLKASPSTSAIPVLFLSARSSVTTRQTAVNAGGDDFMPKPFSPRELRDRVRKILGLG